jgi:Raf kinase inhibitor-like YbhB/YbcL family protein
MEDPDAPGGTFTHWVIFNMKSDITGLGEEIPAMPTVGDNIKQGTNDFSEIGYGGPAPPSGTHHYYIRLYALDKMLNLAAGASRSEVINAMQEYILDMAELMGTYSA